MLDIQAGPEFGSKENQDDTFYKNSDGKRDIF
jgi:hypothetical protein